MTNCQLPMLMTEALFTNDVYLQATITLSWKKNMFVEGKVHEAQCIFGEHYISLILGVPNFPNFSIFPFQNQIISPNMMENELFYQIWGNRPLKAPGI